MIKKIQDSNLLLGEAAYETVREAILSHDLKPGERVSEYKVAEWLGISRTPVREGLRRLETEGLLTQHPRRGLVVASIDDAAVQELYAVRELLEGEAAALAARYATAAEIATIRHLVEVEAGYREAPEQMYDHNRTFHDHIYHATHNRFLLKFLMLTADTLSAYRNISTLVFPERREEVIQEHRELCEAIAKRDPDAARKIATRHVRNALKTRTRVDHSRLTNKAPRRAPGAPSAAEPAAEPAPSKVPE
jgi:DNA-binding GntR family transcriptional regulator